MEFFAWLESTAIAQAIRTVPWIYPALETAHYIGLAMLVGGIMLIDLRLLGLARRLPLRPVIGLIPWVWAGFIVNAVSGSLIFVYGATNFSGNTAFRIKMVLMLLAGVNAMIFTIAAARGGRTWLDAASVPATIKAIATASFVLWLGVLTLGRWMAYI
ncbi:MAG TPA: DUF6644 family protein [Gammaproteobacteria bacterium]|nr:DUF6644 family protein [Gammaproteobacteria bacterium]